jgi:hypothetical protein
MLHLCAGLSVCVADYCCVAGVALTAYRYQRLDLIHQRSAVLALKTPS